MADQYHEHDFDWMNIIIFIIIGSNAKGVGVSSVAAIFKSEA